MILHKALSAKAHIGNQPLRIEHRRTLAAHNVVLVKRPNADRHAPPNGRPRICPYPIGSTSCAPSRPAPYCSIALSLTMKCCAAALMSRMQRSKMLPLNIADAPA